MHGAFFGPPEPAQDKESTVRPENHTEKKRIPVVHNLEITKEVCANGAMKAAHDNQAKHLQGRSDHGLTI